MHMQIKDAMYEGCTRFGYKPLWKTEELVALKLKVKLTHYYQRAHYLTFFIKVGFGFVPLLLFVLKKGLKIMGINQCTPLFLGALKTPNFLLGVFLSLYKQHLCTNLLQSMQGKAFLTA